MDILNFDKRAGKIKAAVELHKGTLPTTLVASEGSTLTFQSAKENILEDMRTAVQQLNSLRTGDRDRRGVDISFADYAKEKWGFAVSDTGHPDNFYFALGINPAQHTVQSLLNMPDMPDGYRWLVPEVVREAIRLGLRRNPIYPSLIAAEETVTQPSQILPYINMSEANVRKLGEAETIPTGTISFGQKSVKLNKVGTGLKVTDEVQQFVSLNLLSLYLQDAGVQLGSALDTLAINVLVNGEQADGSQASGVIGVTTVGAIAYRDILRAWLRMGTLGRMPTSMLSGEDTALDILSLPELKGFAAGTRLLEVDIKTAIPQSQNYYLHGSMPSNKILMLVDTRAALLKLNVGSLKVESERIAERQLSGTYVTVTTGFATIFRDARLIIDGTQAYSGFPSFMDTNSYLNNTALV